ncbi:MAG: aminoacyl-histidine dipeptidase [Lachnospiraceae bacterium]|nr:aminoacyl-histidine dipeptidase [Lachnospiraceae bacterium]
MSTIYELEPKRVFYYFAELCKIPHGSGNLEQISDYLVSFAKEHQLTYRQDAALNVIMTKEASAGYENEPGIILQGHMDMVAVSDPEANIDMLMTPLQVAVDGDELYAEHTSLGGDDGIAVAMALAILEDDSIPHPHLDVVITTNEETGMDGARDIDISTLKGTRLFNLDSEDEGHFLAGCAGGARVDHIFEVTKEHVKGTCYTFRISGLQGGHSGAEIHKERGNANRLMGRFLWRLQQACDFRLTTLDGGLADNAIPRDCTAIFIVPEEAVQEGVVELVAAGFTKDIKVEYQTKDPQVTTRLESAQNVEASCIDQATQKRFLAALVAMPNGVQAMSADVPGLVQTSLNNGVMHIDMDRVYFVTSIRSSVASEKQALLTQIMTITSLAGGRNEIRGDYPGWAYRKESPFRDLCLNVYREMYDKEPIVEAIHAGVECGLLLEKRPDLDCISIGPDMKDIHTTGERLSISSTARVYEYVKRVLAAKSK